MIPEKLVKEFVDWSVTDVYDRWGNFAIEVSIFAYKLALAMAREESDARTAQMHEFMAALIEVHNRETKGESKDTLVYTPKPKDMR